MQGLLIAGFIVLVAVGMYFGWLAAKKRREALAALAQELGWRFDPEKDRDHDERYAHFEIFRRGHGRYAFNTLTGALAPDGEAFAGQSWPAQVGDFHYKVTSSSGKSTQTHTYRFSYLIVELPWPGLPDLLVRPEGVFDKLAGVFGFDDIDFESAEFSKAFHVKSPDKRFAYDVLHARMLELLLAERPPAIDIERGRLCLSDGRSSWSPEQVQERLAFVRRFFARWPGHVLADLGAR